MQDELTPEQHDCALAIANGATRPEAALAVGVSERTVYNWQSEVSGFRQLIRLVRAERAEQLVAKLADGADDAATRLVKVAKGEATTTPTVLEAWKYLLNRVLGKPSGGDPRIAVETTQPDGATVRIIVGHPPERTP